MASSNLRLKSESQRNQAEIFDESGYIGIARLDNRSLGSKIVHNCKVYEVVQVLWRSQYIPDAYRVKEIVDDSRTSGRIEKVSQSSM